ncbi:hypothetical protein MKQ68_07990 [Chitinophaga horti]|uniref:Uncharacterized protein n=1 Tax=Chitinophaga horti TaxID=2920382 RepID=A0ABY6J5U1_9BACT|nr:hypothetical protein [Chitinophaga horti]UYQ95033.1 hypothetical protein MKQ68_07990 [Chitinophaga horti]
MEIKEYIESGIIESFLLGLATPDEEVELQQLRRVFPELNVEIAMAERRLEKLAFEDAVEPPAVAWDNILQRVNWEEDNRDFKKKTKDQHNYYINVEPRKDELITVHKYWKYAFVTIFILSKIFLLGAIIYGLKYYREVNENSRKQPAPAQIERTR